MKSVSSVPHIRILATVHPDTTVAAMARDPHFSVPLCIDLDGTLLLTDATWESLILLWKLHPWRILLTPFWLCRGKSFLKEQIAAEALPDVTLLPYHESLLSFLFEQRRKGRRLLLVTGAHSAVAAAVAKHVGLFAAAYGSGRGINLTGREKARMLVSLFGEKGFDYAGNAAADVRVWEHARQVITVHAPSRVKRRIAAAMLECDFPRQGSSVLPALRALRPHQWLKNLLVFVPVLTSHALGDTAILRAAFLAFLSFSAVASGVYVINDLLDLSADRLHLRKRLRPLAAGHFSIPLALCVALACFSVGLAIAFLLPFSFFVLLLAYIILTSIYSLQLKQIPIVDVLILATLYTARVLAGCAATSIAPSLWLLIFSFLLFFSLALLKRYAELHQLRLGNRTMAGGRGYRTKDDGMVGVAGVMSGILSIVVLAFYVTGDDVWILYRFPALLWLLLPLMMLWVGRLWRLAHRGGMDEDPVLFALRDPISYGIAVLLLAIVFLAS